MTKKAVLLLFLLLLSFSCATKNEGPFYITSVSKDIPKGKIKIIKKGGKLASMTHKKFLQNSGDEKHRLLECKIIDLIFMKFEDGKIDLDAVHKECDPLKETMRENYKIIFKKPCVFRFETIMIQVVKVDPDEIHYRIIRDRG